MKVAVLVFSFIFFAASTGFAEASHKKHKSKGGKSTMDFPSLNPGMFSGDLPADLQNAAGPSKELEGSDDGEQGFDGNSEGSKHSGKSSHKGRKN